MLLWNWDNCCRWLRSHPDSNLLISPNLGNWLGEGEREELFVLPWCHNRSWRKKIHHTQKVLFTHCICASRQAWCHDYSHFVSEACNRQAAQCLGLLPGFTVVGTAVDSLFLPLSHIFSPENKVNTHSNRVSVLLGAFWYCCKKQLAPLARLHICASFMYWNTGGSLWTWGNTFIPWGCWDLSLQLSSGRRVSRCFSSKHFWQRLT